MKTVLVLVLALVSIVYGKDRFQFPNNNSACIIAEFSASFQLTLTEGNQTEPVTFSLPANASVDGSCQGNSSLPSLTLTFDNGDYELLFTLTDNKDEVSAELQFVVVHPNSTFKDFNYSKPIELTSSGVEFNHLGNTTQSYLCNAEENITLASNDTDFKVSATILFSNFQIQGFGVKNATFSDPDECSADMTSTTASTSPMTTIPTPTGVGNYTLKDGNTTCLRMEANISIGVSYKDNQGKNVSRMIMVPGDAEVSGKCGDEEITFNLAVEEKAENETNGNLTFVFKKMKQYSYISSIDFSLKFSDANDTVTGSNDDTDNALSLSTEFFSCNEQKFMLEKDEVVLQELKVQAFDLPDGEFGKSGGNCEDLPPKSPTSGNFTVSDGNITCISMSAAFTLQVNYLDKDSKNKTKNVNIKRDQPAVGQCSSENKTAEFIIVKYKEKKFSIEFQFVKESKVSSTVGADTFTFFVQNITVAYTLDPKIFDDAKDPGESYTFSLTNQKVYETSSDKYYKCSAESTFNINPSVNLITRDLRLVAFNTDPKEPNLFGDNAEECAADTETNSVVPIAVGAALAGLVVIVLIAYLIGRRRNHKGYESV